MDSMNDARKSTDEMRYRTRGRTQTTGYRDFDTTGSTNGSGRSLDRMVREHPLAAGAVALLVGCAIGLLIPSTRREDEMFGPYREQMMRQARSTVEEAKDVARNAVNEAVDTVRSEAEDRGLTPDDAREGLEDTLREGKEVAKKAARNAKDTVKGEADKRNITR